MISCYVTQKLKNSCKNNSRFYKWVRPVRHLRLRTNTIHKTVTKKKESCSPPYVEVYAVKQKKSSV